MKRTNIFKAMLGVAALAAVFGATRARATDANPLAVGNGFSAKEACSCAFVVEQTDEYCSAYGQTGAFPSAITVDRAHKTVTSSFAGVTRVARFTDGAGCILDVP